MRFVAGLVVALVGCAPPSVLTVDSGENTRSGDDTGSWPEVVEPGCPFAGDWNLESAWCFYVDLWDVGAVGTMTASGTPESCDLVFTVDIEGCALVETIRLDYQVGDLWSGYTDGAGNPDCRHTYWGARSIGDVQVTQAENELNIELLDGWYDIYTQINACECSQGLNLSAL